LLPYFATLSVELETLANSYASEQRYTTVAKAHITFSLGADLETGVFRIHSTADVKPVNTNLDQVNPDLTPQVPMSTFTEAASPKLISITGEVFKITKSITSIGRGTEADIQIDDTSVSRLHCEILLGTEVLIRDLGSTNGTSVDGVRANESVVRDGSIIKIGNITLTYQSR
jgi:hypothetical protein